MFKITSLFLYKPLFVLELLLAVFLFSYSLKKKPRFLLRMTTGVLCIFITACLFPVLGYDVIGLSAMFLCLFVATVLLIYFCYDEPLNNIFFCSIAGYSTQHLASAIYSLVIKVTGLEKLQLFGYGNMAQTPDNGFGSVIIYIVYMDIYALTYWMVFLIWGSRLERNEDLRLKRSSTLALTGSIIVADIVLNAWAVSHSYVVEDDTYMALNYVYNALCCLLILVMQFGLLNEKKLTQEVDTVHQLWLQQQRQYTIAKENIDRINIKCHDLKHQIHQIGQGLALNQETIREIEDTVSIYDSTVKTSNEALDIILTEKSLLCSEHHIRVTCLADGEQLGFMKDVDIYSLFGNAMDNAIEAVMKIDDPEKRVIGLKIISASGLLNISLYNYFEGTVEMERGLPITTKSDREDHGFGVRSIQQIVDKYGGLCFFEAEDGVFNLNISFPVSSL